jgi:hypothetical protein
MFFTPFSARLLDTVGRHGVRRLTAIHPPARRTGQVKGVYSLLNDGVNLAHDELLTESDQAECQRWTPNW